jgi:Ran GTPase-activating protein (RanGAP) involved in mRNA processing and transport
MTMIEYINCGVSFKDLANEVGKSGVTCISLINVTLTGGEMDMIRFSKSLRSHETLEEFSLTNVTLEDPETNLDGPISMLLVTAKKIRLLHLDNTWVSMTGSIATAGLCKTLKELRLPNNGLSDSDAAHIATSVAQNPSIQCLDLTGNRMTDVGCAAFGKALQKNISLSVLKLDGNTGISGGSLTEIAFTLSKRSARAA